MTVGGRRPATSAHPNYAVQEFSTLRSALAINASLLDHKLSW